jgi:hypothetical protein
LKDAEPDKEPFPSSSQLAITSGDEVLALEEEASKVEDGLEKQPLLSQPAITSGVEPVLALESLSEPPGEEFGALESSSNLAITSGDEVVPLESSLQLSITSSGDEVFALEDEASTLEDGLEIKPSSSQLAITFGDEVLALVDDPSKAEDGSQQESSLSQLAITSGDEVLAFVDHPSKVEKELESKVAKEDVEKGESGDDNDSNLALRFEGRKASYLLVQRVCGGSSAVSQFYFAEIGSSSRVIVLSASNKVGTDRCSKYT